MATLLDVVCEILGDPWEEFFARVASWTPADCADLHRWLRYWMLSVRFCGICGRNIFARIASWVPADDADLHRWLRYWMLSVGFCGICGRNLFARIARRRPNLSVGTSFAHLFEVLLVDATEGNIWFCEPYNMATRHFHADLL